MLCVDIIVITKAEYLMIDTLVRRIILGTVLWIAFWPILWFFRIGDITGPKAWFWIIGELNYPFGLIAFVIADLAISRVTVKPLVIFVGSVAAVALFMLYFYSRYGFTFGVVVEARFF